MFKDLKEYQDITKIYQDSVNITEEEREIIKIFKEENFTDEELIYVIENFDELYDSEIDLTESLLNEEELQEIKTLIKKGLQKVSQSPVVKKALGGVKKKVTTGAGGLKQRMSAAYDKNIAKGGVQKLKSSLSGIKKTVVSKLEKAKPIIKKGLDTVKKFAPVGVAGAAGFVAGKMSGGDKKPSNTDASGKVIPSTAQIRADAAAKRGGAAAIGGGNAGASTDSGGTSQSTIKSVEPKPKTTETKPKKMHPIEKKNRARLGDARVDALKAKNADFKLMRKGQMSKDDFIKKYPKSITAQRAKGLRDQTEWDAYDLVLEYLHSSGQVATIEEANYVMTEMDAKTIQGIVEEQKKNLSEVRLGTVAKVVVPTAVGLGALGQLAKKDPVGNARQDFQMNYKLKKLSGTGDSPEFRDSFGIPRDYKLTPEQKKKYGL